MRWTFLALCLLALPVRAQDEDEWGLPPALDVGLLVAAEVVTAMDLMQTLDIRHHPDAYETNPLLGQHPSDAKILIFIGASMAGVAAGWALLPRRYRWALPLVVLAVESCAVVHNAQVGLSFRTPF